IIGHLVSCCPAVAYGMLYTKRLEHLKVTALLQHADSFSAKIRLSSTCKLDILWWISAIKLNQGFPVVRDSFDFEIFSDASKSGWGVFCNGVKSHGFWTKDLSNRSINYLELKAALYGIRIFAHDLHNLRILLRIDNTTAISYVNRYGGVAFPSLNEIAREIWQFCEKRSLTLFASYIPSKLNVEADKESRCSVYETEWELSHSDFSNIIHFFPGFSCEVDLFASFTNAKFDQFVAWKPDPYCWKVDAFTICWSHIRFYAFPPFSIISRVLQKIITDEAEGILIVPLWPSQHWFPLFKQICVGNVLHIKPHSHLLFFCDRLHPLNNQLTLIAGFLSGKQWKNKTFQRNPPN
ncbi:unnamed protein product, partial [Allacma fusca]